MPPNSLSDQCIALLDISLQTLLPNPRRSTTRPNPAAALPEPTLNHQQKQHAASLMRVNHAGEVSAQGLYQGQALVARSPVIRAHLLAAAEEETDHLGWCEQRLSELDSAPSLLNPLWFSASLVLGVVAGLAGDSVSLGFLAETEEQVTRHLHHHLAELPTADVKSLAIVQQMASDENNHACAAYAQGAVTFPDLVRAAMGIAARLLTNSSYYI